jgi:hypothetical protein
MSSCLHRLKDRLLVKWAILLPPCVFLTGAVLVLRSDCFSENSANLQSEAEDLPSLAGVSETIRIPPLFVGDALTLQHCVVVRNQTKRRVKFVETRQSCACAGATKLAADELEPGEETVLQFHIDLRQRRGRQRFQCHLIEAGGTEWSYALETVLYERARFDEPGPIHFGMVDTKTDVVRDTHLILHAERKDMLPPNVSVRTSRENLMVEIAPAPVEELPDGTFRRTFPVTLRLGSPRCPGLEQATVYAECDSAGEKQVVQINVTWNLRTLYAVSPSEVYFGTIDTNATEAVKRHVLIRRTDGQPLKLKAGKVTCAGVQCSLQVLKDSSTCRLLLILDPKGLRESLWGEALIETDDTLQPQLRIPVAAVMRPLQE